MTCPTQPLIVVDQDLSLFDEYLMHKGNKYLYSAIKSLSFSLSRFTFNFVPLSNMTLFSIVFDNDHTIIYSADTTFIRGQKSELLEQTYQFLQKLTFVERSAKLRMALINDGFIDLPSQPTVRLYTDGNVEDDKQQRLNLRECTKNKSLSIGVGYGYGLNTSYHPDEIRAHETRSPSCKNKIVFTLLSNQDVFKDLITWVAEPIPDGTNPNELFMDLLRASRERKKT